MTFYGEVVPTRPFFLPWRVWQVATELAVSRYFLIHSTMRARGRLGGPVRIALRVAPQLAIRVGHCWPRTEEGRVSISLFSLSAYLSSLRSSLILAILQLALSESSTSRMETKESPARVEDSLTYGTVIMERPAYQRPRRRIFRTYILAIICVFLLNYYLFPPLADLVRRQISDKHVTTKPVGTSSPAPQTPSAARIPLEAHIMSKCPDARDCLVDLVVPAMEQIEQEVDFQLSYIGSMGSDDNVHCMHGPDECLGNILSLCAQQLFPTDAKRSLGFSTCMIRQYRDIPKRDLVEQCALEHGISFDDINACASEEGRGTGLLEDSVKRSQQADVTKSCTVRLAGEIWCIRDGGEWKNCPYGSSPSDLVKAVRNLQQAKGSLVHR